MRRKNLYATCLLFLATTLSFVFLSVEKGYANSVASVIDGHNSCVQCHGRFPGNIGEKVSKDKNGRPAVIPPNKIDLLCFGCHGPAGIAKKKSHVHGRENYVEKPIGCITCHDPHDNNPNVFDGQNIKLIGQDLEQIIGLEPWSEGHHYAKIKTPNSGVRYVVFESRGTDVGEPSINSFADGDEDRDGLYTGICATRFRWQGGGPP